MSQNFSASFETLPVTCGPSHGLILCSCQSALTLKWLASKLGIQTPNFTLDVMWFIAQFVIRLSFVLICLVCNLMRMLEIKCISKFVVLFMVFSDKTSTLPLSAALTSLTVRAGRSSSHASLSFCGAVVRLAAPVTFAEAY